MIANGRLYLGHLGPIPLFVHWSALLMVVLAWLWSGPRGEASHLTVFLITLTWLVGGIVLHEFGHGIMGRWLGATGITITVWALGGVCSSERSLRPGREIAILAAGPAVSVVLGAACLGSMWYIDARHPLWFDGPTGLWLELWLRHGIWINLGLGLFNCLPLFPLDGGQIAFNGTLLMTRSVTTAAMTTFVLAVLTALGWLGWLWSSHSLDLWDVVLVGFLLQHAWGLVAAARRFR